MSAKHISKSTSENNQSHIPDESLLFEKVIPIILFIMGSLTFFLILFALGVLLGVVKF